MAARVWGRDPFAAALATRAVHRLASTMPDSHAPVDLDARHLGGILLGAMGLALIAWATLRPQPAVLTVMPGACCSWSDAVLNILLFIPLGAGLLLYGLRPGAALLACAVVSGAIELAQHWWIAGRFASIADVWANVTGALLGALAVVHWGSRARWWPKLAPVMAVMVVLIWLLGGQLVRPAVPGPAEWAVEWGEGPGPFQPSRDRVLEVRLQGIPLPDGPVQDQSGLRALLLASESTRLIATIETGSAPGDTATLFQLHVGKGNAPFLVLRQEGRTLRAFQRLGLSWVGLSSPWISLPDALTGIAGDTIRIGLEATRRQLRLEATRGGVVRESLLPLTPELYLSALVYRATDGAVWWVLIPAMCSFVLLGLALAPRPALLVVAALVALVLGANRAGCSYPGWPVVGAAIFGAWVGARAGRSMGLFGSG